MRLNTGPSVVAWHGHRLRFVSIIAAFAMVAAACASDDGSEGSDAAEDPSTDSSASDDGADADSDGEAYEFTVASFLLDDTPNAELVRWWLDEVEARSGGQVTFDYYAAESLCPAAEIVPCVSDGRADLGVTVPGYTPADFPLQELASLPFVTTNNQAMMQALHQVGDEFASAGEAEALGMRAIGYWPAGALLLGTKDPAESMDDLTGLSLRAVGDGLLAAMDAAGANPVALTAGEMYESVERGVIDGVGNNMDAPVSYNLDEVLPHWIDTGYGHYITIGLWMSDPAYESLPGNLQEIIDEVTVEFNEGAGMRAFNTVAEEQCDQLIEGGNVESFTQWDPAATQEWADATGDGPAEAFIADAEAAGVADARDIYERYLELIDEFEAEAEIVAPVDACVERFADL